MAHRYSVSGMVCVRVECADLPSLFHELGRESIPVHDLRYINALEVTFRIRAKYYKRVALIVKKKGASVRIETRSGLYWYFNNIVRRPVLVVGIALVLFLSYYVPGKILFITVEGNKEIPGRYILECAGECGLSIGADRSQMRSEKIKNRILERIPQLQWIGVNTFGCVAVISVRERDTEVEQEDKYAVSSIVARRDGVIVSCTGTKGNVLCKPGQAVKQGDVLISGYTDCGISIRAEQAQGDIYAQTMHTLTVFAPASDIQKGSVTHTEERYSVLIGKKRINFYKDSGILPQGCDMIYEEYYAMLPGGFQLPVAIVKETWYTYENTVVPTSKEMMQNQSQVYAQNYLRAQMIGGQILDSEVSSNTQQDVYILHGKYTCLEMIGLTRREEILKGNG